MTIMEKIMYGAALVAGAAALGGCGASKDSIEAAADAEFFARPHPTAGYRAENPVPKELVRKYDSLIDQAAAQGNLDGIMQHEYNAEARERLGLLGFRLDDSQLMIGGVKGDIETLETRYLTSKFLEYHNPSMGRALSLALEKFGPAHEVTQAIAQDLKARMGYVGKCEGCEEHVAELKERLSAASTQGKYQRIKSCADILGDIKEKEDELDAAMEECTKATEHLKGVLGRHFKEENKNGKRNN